MSAEKSARPHRGAGYQTDTTSLILIGGVRVSGQRVSFLKEACHKSDASSIWHSHHHCPIKSVIDCFTRCFRQKDACMTGSEIRKTGALSPEVFRAHRIS